MRHKEKICLHCLRPCKKPPAQTGKKQNVPLCRTSAPTEGRLWSLRKNCAPQNRCNGKPRQHRDVKGSVNACSLSLCRCNSKPFSHIGTIRLQIDSVSHWTLHSIVFHGTRFSAHRQLMAHFTSAVLRTTSEDDFFVKKTFSEPVVCEKKKKS